MERSLVLVKPDGVQRGLFNWKSHHSVGRARLETDGGPFSTGQPGTG